MYQIKTISFYKYTKLVDIRFVHVIMVLYKLYFVQYINKITYKIRRCKVYA